MQRPAPVRVRAIAYLHIVILRPHADAMQNFFFSHSFFHGDNSLLVGGPGDPKELATPSPLLAIASYEGTGSTTAYT